MAIDLGIEWMLDPLTTTCAVSSAFEAGVAGDDDAGEVVSELEGDSSPSGEDSLNPMGVEGLWLPRVW